MNPSLFPARWLRGVAWGVLAWLMLASLAKAHDFRVGAIVIEHAYATPAAAGASSGLVFFR